MLLQVPVFHSLEFHTKSRPQTQSDQEQTVKSARQSLVSSILDDVPRQIVHNKCTSKGMEGRKRKRKHFVLSKTEISYQTNKRKRIKPSSSHQSMNQGIKGDDNPVRRRPCCLASPCRPNCSSMVKCL